MTRLCQALFRRLILGKRFKLSDTTIDVTTDSTDSVEDQPGVQPTGQGSEDAPVQDAEPKTFTQDEVNSFMAKEKRALTEKYGDLEALLAKAQKADEYEQSQLTEQEKLDLANKAKDEEFNALKAELEAFKSSALREKVAREAGIDPALAARLQGATEEELLEDAKSFAALLPMQPQTETKAPKSPAPIKNLKGGGEPDNGDELAGLDIGSFLNGITRQ